MNLRRGVGGPQGRQKRKINSDIAQITSPIQNPLSGIKKWQDDKHAEVFDLRKKEKELMKELKQRDRQIAK